jgi:NCAIR mutase (PurE)-related protein
MQEKIKKVENIGRLDIQRDKRCGIPEVVFAEGKKPEWVAELLKQMLNTKGMALATRVDSRCFREIKKKLPHNLKLKYEPQARTVLAGKINYKTKNQLGKVGLIAAGTADIAVAEEARVVMEFLGCSVISAYDVGVAGIHRLIVPLEKMFKEKVVCIVVVAGMEGALPTVVKGLVDVPVIGVPTSVGYGYGGKGEAALMTMLQSCSPGLVVVNIDNGFGAACAAALIVRKK